MSHPDMPPLRVLVIAPTPFFGDRGCHIRIYEEVRALTRLGVESHVVTYPAGQDVPGVQIERARRIPGVRPRALGPSLGRPLLDLALWQATRRATRRVRPHLIHAHLHEGIAVGMCLRASTGLPLIADLQGSLTEELIDHRFIPARGPLPGLVRRFERWLSCRPDRILTSSSHGVSLLTAQGVPPDRIDALPDGVDLEAFRPLPRDAALVDRLGLTGKRVVVFLGVLTPYQGVDVLLDAASVVTRSMPEAHFLIMGYPNEARYEAEARARGLERAVTLPGRVPYGEAARWLGLGEVAVSAKQSLTEANGKLLNYMACGLACVASETPVNRELLGDEGVYAAVGHADEFAEQILALLADPDRTRARGAALRQRAAQMFAWPVLAQQLAEIYRQALGGAGVPSPPERGRGLG